MSIKDDFIYLNTTKKLLKNEINKVNNVLDDNSTFRSYPQELFNGYLDILNNGTDTLWNNLEKVSASGEEATLENVETAPIKIMLNGNTSQETTTGKNLVDYLDVKGIGVRNGTDNVSANSVSITDNVLTIIKTYSQNGEILKFNNIDLPTINQGENVTISFIPNKTISGVVGIANYNGGGTSNINREVRFVENSIFAITLEALSTYNRLGIFIQGMDESIGIKDLMVELGSTATSYEPYTGGQPSPSPDYPQQVKVVTGENVVSVQGKNLFDKSSNIVLNKYIGEDGAISGNSPRNWYQEDYIEVSNSTDYIISTTSSNYVRVAFYDDSKNFISRIVANGGIQISTTSSTKYLRLSGYDNLNDNIQLELGSATPYVPYSKTDYPINLGTIELCKIGDYKDYLFKRNGKWYKYKAINKIVLNGSEDWKYTSNVFYLTYSMDTSSIAHLRVQNYVPYSNNFKGVINYNNTGQFYSNSQNNNFGLNLNAIQHNIYVRYDSITSTEDFKTWLSTHNTEVYYPLATPTEEEITDTTLIAQLEAIYKAKSVKDKTYITQTNDELPFVLDIQAIKEYNVD